jgi:hypothetical protein
MLRQEDLLSPGIQGQPGQRKQEPISEKKKKKDTQYNVKNGLVLSTSDLCL